MSDKTKKILKASFALLIDLVIGVVVWRLINKVFDFRSFYAGWRYWTLQISMAIFLYDLLRLFAKLLTWASGGYLGKE